MTETLIFEYSELILLEYVIKVNRKLGSSCR